MTTPNTNLANSGEKIEPLNKEKAEHFFGELFYGKHHIPSEVKPYGYDGWYIFCNTGLSFATTDFNNLTRLVLMAHRDLIRAEIKTHSPGRLKICIWQRQAEGDLTKRHPDLPEAIYGFNKFAKSRGHNQIDGFSI